MSRLAEKSAFRYRFPKPCRCGPGSAKTAKHSQAAHSQIRLSESLLYCNANNIQRKKIRGLPEAKAEPPKRAPPGIFWDLTDYSTMNTVDFPCTGFQLSNSRLGPGPFYILGISVEKKIFIKNINMQSSLGHFQGKTR